MTTSTSTAQKLVARAVELREAGRTDEAILAARQATALEPDDANAWWQLALATIDREGAASAIPSLRRTVARAPNFAHGWHRLGLALDEAGEADEAITCWEAALEIKGDRQDTLASLAVAYGARKNDGDGDKRFALLRRMESLGILRGGGWNDLGVAYHDRKQHHDAIRCYRRLAAESGGHVPYFNLGLALDSPEVRKATDAIDAWRRALSLCPDYERARLCVEAALPKALGIRKRVGANSEPRLRAEERHANYINPYELLDLLEGDTPLDELDAKDIQRAKKRLLAVIELEDGVVEWMPGPPIDKSKAIMAVDQLLDDGLAKHHRRVAENDKLRLFLSRGDIDFLVDSIDSPLVLLRQFEEEDGKFAAWLGVPFAAQFDLVLSRAIEARDVDAIEALVGGRLLVAPALEDRCFAAAERQLVRTLRPVKLALAEATNLKASAASIESTLSKGRVKEMVALLPAHFQEIQRELAANLRSLSISAHNDHDDTEGALKILDLGRALAFRSPTLLGQIDEDSKTLSKIAERLSANDASVVLRDVKYSIARAGVDFGGKRFNLDQVSAVRFGATGIRDQNGSGWTFELAVRGDFNGAELSWTSYRDLDAQNELFKKMTNAAMHYLLPGVLRRMEASLDARQTLRVGAAVASKAGILFAIPSFWGAKDLVCPWSRLSASIDNGDLVLADPSERKARLLLPLAKIDNAIALYVLADKLRATRSER